MTNNWQPSGERRRRARAAPARWGWTVAIIAGLLGSLAFTFAPMPGANLCPPSFSDEFDGTRVDTTHWQPTYKSGAAERQSYVPEALSESGGLLTITAQPQTGQSHPYTSGALTSLGKFSQQYGYFEMRARLPSGQGLWPAFWLLHTGPQPWTEVDIFENLGNDPSVVYLSNHWHDDASQHQFLTQPFAGPDFSQGFHTFGLNWAPDSLTWYVDGVPVASTRDNVPAEPMFILANLAVGGVWPGYPDASTRFPARMQIDYIRVYAAKCRQGLFDQTGAWRG